jgi:6-phosphogluconolactonase
MALMARISRRVVVAMAPLLPLMTRILLSQANAGRKPLLYIGTYTHDMGPGGEADGIYMGQWDENAGSLTPLERAAETADPSFLAVTPSGDALFCVNETETSPQPDRTKGGSVSAFRRDHASGRLMPQNSVPSGGSDPCHITTDRAGRVVFVANYSSGTLSSYRVNPQGLDGPVAHIPFHGSGPNKERQEGPHTHGVTLSPDERFLLVNDLGIDRIMVFHTNLATGELKETGAPWQAKPGSGPRHSIFHPNGRWVYSINEMASTVDVLAWNAQSGHLTFRSEVLVHSASFTGQSKAAELLVDHTGRFLYASNRGEETLVVFAIDPQTGALSFVQRVSSGGKTPRSFTLDPSQKWLIVANQDSQNIVVFARDPKSGNLKQTERSYRLGAPVSLLFV